MLDFIRPFSQSSVPRFSSLVKISTTVRSLSMADKNNTDSHITKVTVDPKDLVNYPIPLSPPLPSISKDIELSRAMSASSKSSLFSLSRTDVLLEDEWLIVVNKPQGIYCENVLSSVPNLLSQSNDSDNKLAAELNKPELHLANRLDRDTSGVMVITKSHKVAAKLVKAFTNHKVKKTYVAFCIGRAPQWRKITLKSGHGRSKFGAWRVYATSDVGRTLPGGSSIREMETLFEVLSVNGKIPFTSEEKNIIVEQKSLIDRSEENDEIVVRACPKSGRTHQIRLHCQYLGIPIRGDVKYEGVTEWKGREYECHELHAESLCFEHPVTGVPVLIRAPLPVWASLALNVSQ